MSREDREGRQSKEVVRWRQRGGDRKRRQRTETDRGDREGDKKGGQKGEKTRKIKERKARGREVLEKR